MEAPDSDLRQCVLARVEASRLGVPPVHGPRISRKRCRRSHIQSNSNKNRGLSEAYDVSDHVGRKMRIVFRSQAGVYVMAPFSLRSRVLRVKGFAQAIMVIHTVRPGPLTPVGGPGI